MNEKTECSGVTAWRQNLTKLNRHQSWLTSEKSLNCHFISQTTASSEIGSNDGFDILVGSGYRSLKNNLLTDEVGLSCGSSRRHHRRGNHVFSLLKNMGTTLTVQGLGVRATSDHKKKQHRKNKAILSLTLFLN